MRGPIKSIDRNLLSLVRQRLSASIVSGSDTYPYAFAPSDLFKGFSSQGRKYTSALFEHALKDLVGLGIAQTNGDHYRIPYSEEKLEEMVNDGLFMDLLARRSISAFIALPVKGLLWESVMRAVAARNWFPDQIRDTVLKLMDGPDAPAPDQDRGPDQNQDPDQDPGLPEPRRRIVEVPNEAPPSQRTKPSNVQSSQAVSAYIEACKDAIRTAVPVNAEPLASFQGDQRRVLVGIGSPKTPGWSAAVTAVLAANSSESQSWNLTWSIHYPSRDGLIQSFGDVSSKERKRIKVAIEGHIGQSLSNDVLAMKARLSPAVMEAAAAAIRPSREWTEVVDSEEDDLSPEDTATEEPSEVESDPIDESGPEQEQGQEQAPVESSEDLVQALDVISLLDDEQRRRLMVAQEAILVLMGGQTLSRSEIFKSQEKEPWHGHFCVRLESAGILVRTGKFWQTRWTGVPEKLSELSLEDMIPLVLSPYEMTVFDSDVQRAKMDMRRPPYVEEEKSDPSVLTDPDVTPAPAPAPAPGLEERVRVLEELAAKQGIMLRQAADLLGALAVEVKSLKDSLGDGR